MTKASEEGVIAVTDVSGSLPASTAASVNLRAASNMSDNLFASTNASDDLRALGRCEGLRLNIAGLGDVGRTVLEGLVLLGREISEIGIYDAYEPLALRLEMEMNQILSPDGRKMPRVRPVAKDKLFDCDVFVFCATAGVPPVKAETGLSPSGRVADNSPAGTEAAPAKGPDNSPAGTEAAPAKGADNSPAEAKAAPLPVKTKEDVQSIETETSRPPSSNTPSRGSEATEGSPKGRKEAPQDVRMAQLSANRELIRPYAKMAREAGFKGLFCQVSDPVDLLAHEVYMESNRDEKGGFDGKGLAPWQVRGFGLGVMAARAAYFAEKEGVDFSHGRVFGPHGEGLVVANDYREGFYDDELSRRLTWLTLSANLKVRELGFKPYIAPGLSSAAVSILKLLRGEFHYSATAFREGAFIAYFGCLNRISENGTPEFPEGELALALLERVKESFRVQGELQNGKASPARGGAPGGGGGVKCRIPS